MERNIQARKQTHHIAISASHTAREIAASGSGSFTASVVHRGMDPGGGEIGGKKHIMCTATGGNIASGSGSGSGRSTTIRHRVLSLLFRRLEPLEDYLVRYVHTLGAYYVPVCCCGSASGR